MRTADFLTIGLSPAIQKTVLFRSYRQGEVNRAQQYYTDAAGKCINVCRVLIQGGMKAECLTIAGRENRAALEALCRRDGMLLHTVESAGRVRTCTTIVETDKNECTELVVNEPERISRQEEESFRGKFLELLSNGYGTALISGSRLPGFSDDIIPFMVDEIKDRGMRLYADYKGKDLHRSFISGEKHPDCVKINDKEFLETFPEYPDLPTGLKEMSRRYNCLFVISRGAASTLTAAGGDIREVPSKRLKAVNPIGCGDSMTAGLAQGFFEGLPLGEAVLKGRDYAARNAMSLHPGWIS